MIAVVSLEVELGVTTVISDEVAKEEVSCVAIVIACRATAVLYIASGNICVIVGIG